METSIRYGADSKALRIHAKEKFPIDSNTHLQFGMLSDDDCSSPYEWGVRLLDDEQFKIESRRPFNSIEWHSKGYSVPYYVHGELDTKIGAPSYLSAMIRHFYPDLSASLGVGLQYNRHEKVRYSVRGKTAFPVTTNGLLQFNIKGRCDVDKEFRERKLKGAAEFTWGILDFQKDQDMRLKVGYEIFDKVPYLQIRENNWMLNVDINGRWNVRYDLWTGESLI